MIRGYASVRGMKFINRTSELEFLDQCLAEAIDEPALIIVSGPTGVGKSSLSDRFREIKETKQIAFCAVDPELLDSPASRSIYQGLFLQKCAVALDQRSRMPGASWPTFSDFLKGRRWQAVKEKPKHELLAELPSIKSFYKQAMDYASRVLMIGKFRAEYMLSLNQIAKRDGRCRKQLTKLVGLSWLSPNVMEALSDGSAPTSLTRKRLLDADLPLAWSYQE